MLMRMKMMMMMGKRMPTRPPSSSSSFCPLGRWIRILTFNPPHLCPSSYLSFHSESRNFSTLDEALSCFNGMLHMHPPPSVVDFNKVLTSIADMEHFSTVISLSHQMDSLGIRPNPDTLDTLTTSFCRLNRLDFGFSVLAKTLKLGHPQPNFATYNTLIRELCVKDEIHEAIRFFYKMVWVDDPLFLTYSEAEMDTCETLLINGLWKEGPKHALNRMTMWGLSNEQGHHHQQVNPPPTSLITEFYDFDVDGALNEIVDFFSLGNGETVVRTLTGSSMIHTQCRNCVWKLLVMLFLEVVDGSISRMPNYATFSIVVNELCRNGKITEAHDKLNEMIQRGMKPDVGTYNVLMDGYCVRSETDEALKILNTMVHNGTMPDACSYIIFIILYLKNHRIDKAMHLFEQMCQKKSIAEYETYETLDTLIDGLCTAGELKAARDLLLNLPSMGLKPVVGAYNNMIQWLCDRCLIKEASELLMDMGENIGCSPDYSTKNIIVLALLQNDETLRALQLLQEMLSGGFAVDSSILALLLKMISDGGLVKQQIIHWLSNLRGLDEYAMY